MPHSLETEISSQLTRYIRGEITIDDFADWLVPEALYLDEHANEFPAAAELAAQADLRLIEYYDDLWTEEELRGLLAPLASSPPRSDRRFTSGSRTQLAGPRRFPPMIDSLSLRWKAAPAGPLRVHRLFGAAPV